MKSFYFVIDIENEIAYICFIDDFNGENRYNYTLENFSYEFGLIIKKLFIFR